jgi:hypothetical protein
MTTSIEIVGSSNDTNLVLASSGSSIAENGSSNLVPLTGRVSTLETSMNSVELRATNLEDPLYNLVREKNGVYPLSNNRASIINYSQRNTQTIDLSDGETYYIPNDGLVFYGLDGKLKAPIDNSLNYSIDMSSAHTTSPNTYSSLNFHDSEIGFNGDTAKSQNLYPITNIPSRFTGLWKGNYIQSNNEFAAIGHRCHITETHLFYTTFNGPDDETDVSGDPYPQEVTSHETHLANKSIFLHETNPNIMVIVRKRNPDFRHPFIRKSLFGTHLGDPTTPAFQAITTYAVGALLDKGLLGDDLSLLYTNAKPYTVAINDYLQSLDSDIPGINTPTQHITTLFFDFSNQTVQLLNTFGIEEVLPEMVMTFATNGEGPNNPVVTSSFDPMIERIFSTSKYQGVIRDKLSTSKKLLTKIPISSADTELTRELNSYNYANTTLLHQRWLRANFKAYENFVLTINNLSTNGEIQDTIPTNPSTYLPLINFFNVIIEYYRSELQTKVAEDGVDLSGSMIDLDWTKANSNLELTLSFFKENSLQLSNNYHLNTS